MRTSTSRTVLKEFGSQFKPKAVKRTEKALAKARTKDSMAAFSKLTREVDGEARIVAEPPLIVPIDDLADGHASAMRCSTGCTSCCAPIAHTLEHDRRVLLEQFRLTDFARKVVGVGSVGTRAWIALMLGRDGQDPLFLQMKEAEASVLEEFVAAERVREPRRAGRQRTAADAGLERHLPRLAARRGRESTARHATSTVVS